MGWSRGVSPDRCRVRVEERLAEIRSQLVAGGGRDGATGSSGLVSAVLDTEEELLDEAAELERRLLEAEAPGHRSPP